MQTRSSQREAKDHEVIGLGCMTQEVVNRITDRVSEPLIESDPATSSNETAGAGVRS